MHSSCARRLIALAFCCSDRRTGAGSHSARAARLAGLGAQGRGIPPLPVPGIRATSQPGEPIDADAFRCVWPERLTLAVDARGGTFTQRWQVFADSWVALPGDLEHWPQDVRVNGAPARGGRARRRAEPAPRARQLRGRRPLQLEHAARSRCRCPRHRPRRSDRRRPARRAAGASRWRASGSASAAAPSSPPPWKCRFTAWCEDQIPAYLLTRIRLNVAGDAREELLGRVLPDGFTPLSLDGDVARAPRTRRHAARAGARRFSHEITLVARGTDGGRARSRGPIPAAASGRARKSGASPPTTRCASRRPKAPRASTPSQANVPREWQRFPGVPHGRGLEAERGRTQPRPEQCRRQPADAEPRPVAGFRSRRLHRASTTSPAPCAATGGSTCRRPSQLQSARQGGDQLLVTAGEEGRAGLELRAAAAHSNYRGAHSPAAAPCRPPAGTSASTASAARCTCRPVIG